jgi:hypothetical protein
MRLCSAGWTEHGKLMNAGMYEFEASTFELTHLISDISSRRGVGVRLRSTPYRILLFARN